MRIIKRFTGISAFFVLLMMCFLMHFAFAEGTCGHQWILQNRVSPGCTENGLEVYRCSLCGAETTVSIPALGHEYVSCTIVKNATCTENGINRCFCSRNASHYKDNTIPALGHAWGEWHTVKKASLNTPGLKERICSRCNCRDQQRISERIQRKKYDLSLLIIPVSTNPDYLTVQQISENGDYLLEYECILINTGKEDLQIQSYTLNGETELLPREEPLILPAGQTDRFPLFWAVSETEVYRNPDDQTQTIEKTIQSEYCFYGENKTGEVACTSNTVALSCLIVPESDTISLSRARGVQISQALVSEPTDPAGYQLYEIIRYTVSLTNQSDKVLAQVIIKGIETDEELCITDLSPGETRLINCEHRVTMQDVSRGYLCWEQLTDTGEEADRYPSHSNYLVVPVIVK